MQLQTLGKRTFLKDAIRQLRKKSAKYQAQLQHEFSFRSAVSLVLPPSHGPDTPTNSRETHDQFVFDETGNKRRKLDLSPSNGNPERDLSLLWENGDNPPPTVPLTPANQITNEKKQKRIAPTLITSEIDPDRSHFISSAADFVVRHDPSNIEPGVVFFDEDGKKRLVPVHQPASDEVPCDYHNLLRKPQSLDEGGEHGLVAAKQLLQTVEKKKLQSDGESLAIGYLGKQKLAVDDLFYTVPIGQKLVETGPSDFFENPKTLSAGRRMYVHHAMKHFLKSEHQIFRRKGKFFSAVTPYPAQLIPVQEKPSFTLYYAGKDGKIYARREDRAAWPEIDPEAPPLADDDTKTTFTTGYLENAIAYRENFDPDSLEKYLHIHGGDEVLPFYGDSGEENEYDMDTWKEMEEEFGTLEKPKRPLKRPHLSLEQVEQAIDEGIAELVATWHDKKKPQKAFKAYGIWKKFHSVSLPYF
jgi:hypothetical protein